MLIFLDIARFQLQPIDCPLDQFPSNLPKLLRHMKPTHTNDQTLGVQAILAAAQHDNLSALQRTRAGYTPNEVNNTVLGSLRLAFIEGG